jgi:hypothetical protein
MARNNLIYVFFVKNINVSFVLKIICNKDHKNEIYFYNKFI